LRAPAKETAKGLRVALWLDDPFAPAAADTRKAVEEAAHHLADAGAEIDPIARPAFSFAEAWEIFAVLNHAVIGYGLPEKVRSKLAAMARDFRPDDLSHRALQARGARITPGAFNAIDVRRRALRRKWARFFEKFDVVLCPPAAVAAFPHDQSADMQKRVLRIDAIEKPYFDIMFWACLASGADLPAVVAPVLRGADGLPCGVQIIAADGADRTALAVARLLEALTGGFVAPPLT
jgi:amidase